MSREPSDPTPIHPEAESSLPPAARRRAAAALLAIACAFFAACDSSSPTEPCPGPMHISGPIVAPVKIFAPQPAYTEAARRAGTEGAVIVQTIIDCRGLVTDVTVLQGQPNGLTEAVVAAVSRWRFEPATLDGMPVSVFFNLTVNFRLA